jgi:hypothetical protein
MLALRVAAVVLRETCLLHPLRQAFRVTGSWVPAAGIIHQHRTAKILSKPIGRLPKKRNVTEIAEILRTPIEPQ